LNFDLYARVTAVGAAHSNCGKMDFATGKSLPAMRSGMRTGFRKK